MYGILIYGMIHEQAIADGNCTHGKMQWQPVGTGAPTNRAGLHDRLKSKSPISIDTSFIMGVFKMETDFKTTLQIAEFIKDTAVQKYVIATVSSSEKVEEFKKFIEEKDVEIMDVHKLMLVLNVKPETKFGGSKSPMTCLSCGMETHKVKWSSEYNVTLEDGTSYRAKRVTLEEEGCSGFEKGSKLEYLEGNFPEKTFLSIGQVNGCKKWFHENPVAK